MLLALAGDAILTFVRVLPLAGPIALGAWFFATPYIRVPAVIAILFLIWVLRPGSRDSGESLARNEAPDLHAAIDDLKKRIDIGARIDVRLDDKVNASAREVRGLFGVAGVRRVLTLGVPLLALLGKEETRAVIAHEFGHFSREHGRFGHWLYWAHLDWLSYAARVDHDSSSLARAGVVFAELFAPAFSRRAMVWSRRCEYEADADAARAVGGAPLIGGLARLDAYSAWSGEDFPRIVRGWQCAESAAPSDWLERMFSAFEATPFDRLAELHAGEASRPDNWLDTHPVLAQRAAALAVPPYVGPREPLTGSALLGSLWPSVVADYNARWRKDNAVAWAVAHARWRLIEAPLIAAQAVAGWPIAQRLARAKALRRSEPERGLGELTALHAEAPGDRGTTFACAAARLAEGDAGAVEPMRALARDDATWHVPVCARMIRYYEKIGDRARANRWAEQMENSAVLEARAHDRVCDDIIAGKHAPTTRPAVLIDTLRAGFAADPVVARAWLVESKVSLDVAATARAATMRADALILVIDPFDTDKQPNDDDAVRSRHREALADLIEPNVLPAVISFYTTEAVPAALQATLDRLPPSSAYVR